MAKKRVNPVVKNILSALAIVVLGFLMFIVAFIVDALFQGVIRGAVGMFIPLNENSEVYWFPPLMHGLYVVFVGVVTWLVLRTKIRTLFKAIFLTAPLAVIFATIGLSFYQTPAIVYALGGLFGLGVLYYLYRTKQPWQYYFSVLFVGIVMLLVGILGVEV